MFFVCIHTLTTRIWIIQFVLIVTMISISGFSKSPKVVVIGAGIGGLTTAYRLQQKGIDVEIYEARGRVGGRILTAQINNNIVELGAENIADGGKADNLQHLIKELGLEVNEKKISTHRFYYDREHMVSLAELSLNDSFEHENLRNKLNLLSQSCKNMREMLNALLDEKGCLYKSLALRLAAYEGDSIDNLSPFYKDTLYSMLLGGIAKEHKLLDEEVHVMLLSSIQGGNSQLPEKIAAKLEDRIHLNKTLMKVAKKTDHSFVLTFQDGVIVKADILVLAIPCSVYDTIVFENDVIPSEKLDGIKQISYGTNAKIMVPFSQAQDKRYGFMNDQMICFFDANCTNLTLYYTGNSSFFSETTIASIYAQDRSMLEKGYKQDCPSMTLPVMARDESYRVYHTPVGYSWPNDPYVKGSYSYIKPGQEAMLTTLQETQGELSKILFTPIEQKIYFVGEHASILMDVPGTMEAACESGERAFRMIMRNCSPLS